MESKDDKKSNTNEEEKTNRDNTGRSDYARHFADPNAHWVRLGMLNRGVYESYVGRGKPTDKEKEEDAQEWPSSEEDAADNEMQP